MKTFIQYFTEKSDTIEQIKNSQNWKRLVDSINGERFYIRVKRFWNANIRILKETTVKPEMHEFYTLIAEHFDDKFKPLLSKEEIKEYYDSLKQHKNDIIHELLSHNKVYENIFFNQTKKVQDVLNRELYPVVYMSLKNNMQRIIKEKQNIVKQKYGNNITLYRGISDVFGTDVKGKRVISSLTLDIEVAKIYGGYKVKGSGMVYKINVPVANIIDSFDSNPFLNRRDYVMNKNQKEFIAYLGTIPDKNIVKIADYVKGEEK